MLFVRRAASGLVVMMLSFLGNGGGRIFSFVPLTILVISASLDHGRDGYVSIALPGGRLRRQAARQAGMEECSVADVAPRPPIIPSTLFLESGAGRQSRT